MSDFQIYRKIIVFVLPRFLCVLLAFVLSFIIIFAIAILAYSFSPTHATIVIITILAIYIWYLIFSFMKMPYQSASISLMVKACNGEQISDHPYKEGMDDVRKRFGVISAFELVKVILKFVFDKDKTDQEKNQFISDIKSFFVFFIINTISYLNACVLSVVMFYKEKTYSQCIFETFEVLRKNFFRVVLKALGIFLLYSVLPVLIFAIICILLAGFLFNTTSITSSNLLLIRLLGFGNDIAGFKLYLIILVFLAIAYVYISPRATIKIVRIFVKMYKDTYLENKYYDKFMNISEKNKILRRIKEADNEVKKEMIDE